MSVITKSQFIQLADRLAATYDLLLQAEKKYLAPPEQAIYQQGQAYPARLLLDLTGTGTQVLFTAKTTGVLGNSIYFSVVLPSTPNATLDSSSLGTNLVLSLATDANSKSNTLVEDAVVFMQSTAAFTDHVDIIYPVSGIGGYVQPQAMTALSGGIGSGSEVMPLFTITTTRPGSAGNFYTLTIEQPTTHNQVFDVCWNQTDLVITLPTDGSGAATETLGELQTDLASATSDFRVITESPSTLTPAVSQTTFSGGSVGSYAQVVLTPPSGATSADPDVANGLMIPAQALDLNFTAYNLSQGLDYINNFQQALVGHFISVGYSGGMAGYLSDNNILVHKNFSTVNSNRLGTTLKAANVFRPDQVVLGTVAKGSGSTITFTAGTSLGAADGGLQSETNYGPQELVVVLVPAGGSPLAANWSFTLTLLDSNGVSHTSDTIVFSTSDPVGTKVSVMVSSVAGRYYSVSDVTLVSGGSNGDNVFITQIVERQISL